ncbi:MAG: hypothetical protein ACXVZR_02535 [Terriglobales bacterium]
MAIHGEEQFASLIAGAGIVWSVNFVTSSPVPARAMVFPAGPLEICALGILVWLHAKWRRTRDSNDRHYLGSAHY